MVFFPSFGARPVDPVHRTWLLKQLCWCNGGGGRQTDGVPGTGRDGSTAAEDQNVWLVKNPPEKPQMALAHTRFLPLLLLLLGPLYEDPLSHHPFWAAHPSICLFLGLMQADIRWGVIPFQMLPRPLTYRVSEKSYLQEPPYLFSYKLATSLEPVMNLKQTSLCPVGGVWKENLWVLKLLQRISSCLSSFCCIILSCCNRFVLEWKGTGMQPGFHNTQILPFPGTFSSGSACMVMSANLSSLPFLSPLLL